VTERGQVGLFGGRRIQMDEIFEEMQRDLDAGRYACGDASKPSRGAWEWLQGFARVAQSIVRDRKPLRMRVLITWEHEAQRMEACPKGCPITDADSKTPGGRDVCGTCGEIV
jgi:hypothetical protein